MRNSKVLATMFVLVGLIMVISTSFSVFAGETASQGLIFNNPVSSSVALVGDATVDFGEITAGTEAYALDAASVTGSSNAAWTLTLSGEDFVSGVNTILKDDCLKVRAGTDAYTKIGAGLALTSSHTAGSETFVMDYELNVPSSAHAGNYSSSLTYTISN